MATDIAAGDGAGPALHHHTHHYPPYTPDSSAYSYGTYSADRGHHRRQDAAMDLQMAPQEVLAEEELEQQDPLAAAQLMHDAYVQLPQLFTSVVGVHHKVERCLSSIQGQLMAVWQAPPSEDSIIATRRILNAARRSVLVLLAEERTLLAKYATAHGLQPGEALKPGLRTSPSVARRGQAKTLSPDRAPMPATLRKAVSPARSTKDEYSATMRVSPVTGLADTAASMWSPLPISGVPSAGTGGAASAVKQSQPDSMGATATPPQQVDWERKVLTRARKLLEHKLKTFLQEKVAQPSILSGQDVDRINDLQQDIDKINSELASLAKRSTPAPAPAAPSPPRHQYDIHLMSPGQLFTPTKPARNLPQHDKDTPAAVDSSTLLQAALNRFGNSPYRGTSPAKPVSAAKIHPIPTASTRSPTLRDSSERPIIPKMRLDDATPPGSPARTSQRAEPEAHPQVVPSATPLEVIAPVPVEPVAEIVIESPANKATTTTNTAVSPQAWSPQMQQVIDQLLQAESNSFMNAVLKAVPALYDVPPILSDTRQIDVQEVMPMVLQEDPTPPLSPISHPADDNAIPASLVLESDDEDIADVARALHMSLSKSQHLMSKEAEEVVLPPPSPAWRTAQTRPRDDEAPLPPPSPVVSSGPTAAQSELRASMRSPSPPPAPDDEDFGDLAPATPSKSQAGSTSAPVSPLRAADSSMVYLDNVPSFAFSPGKVVQDSPRRNDDIGIVSPFRRPVNLFPSPDKSAALPPRPAAVKRPIIVRDMVSPPPPPPPTTEPPRMPLQPLPVSPAKRYAPPPTDNVLPNHADLRQSWKLRR